jgi:hypothetical protein
MLVPPTFTPPPSTIAPSLLSVFGFDKPTIEKLKGEHEQMI